MSVPSRQPGRVPLWAGSVSMCTLVHYFNGIKYPFVVKKKTNLIYYNPLVGFFYYTDIIMQYIEPSSLVYDKFDCSEILSKWILEEDANMN